MKRGLRAGALLLCALLLAASLCPQRGRAATVYFTAANENVMELLPETMPFWSDGQLYVSNALFQGRELGVNYVRNDALGLAMLYTNSTDLRFDIVNDTVYDRDQKTYSGHAIVKGSYVFFPIDLVCRYFGLEYTCTETELAPLIRITSDSVILGDSRFIDSATTILIERYNTYQRLLAEQTPAPPPVYQAAEGQKVFLLIESTSAQDTLALLDGLDGVQVTFLLPAELMEDGDLVRAVAARGHGLALAARGDTEAEVQAQLELAREQVWQAALLWLDLVWYDGGADISQLLANLGCVRLSAQLDRQEEGLASASQAAGLMTSIGRYREDLAVRLGTDAGCAGGLGTLTAGLTDRKYSLCAWRLAG